MTEPADLRLVQTCGACPEQYDAFLGDRKVGYIRLRHGSLSVECPGVCDETVYEHEFDDQWQGAFDDDGQRQQHLSAALAAIAKWVDAGS